MVTETTRVPSKVKAVHADLVDRLPDYVLIDDCLEGQRRIKKKGKLYLPQINPTDTSDANVQRNKDYVTRAVFLNVTRRTLAGLLGALFETEIVQKLPPALEPIVDDASGGGISLPQLAHKLAGTVLSKGRAGIFVDFPDTGPGGASKLDQEQKKELLRPNITVYQPQDIRNWRVQEIGGVDVLTFVVLHETYVVEDDGYSEKRKSQWRELRLVGDPKDPDKLVYIQRLWREDVQVSETTPRQATTAGQPEKTFDRIPFFFVGSENNDADIDYPPMYDMAELNVAHYRNSADYEEAVYVIGQPTLWISGLTADWVREVLKGEVQLGSRAAVLMPADAAAGLIQVEPNSMALEAMTQKERQMVALGARLVEQRSVERTATEAVIEDKGENSVLGSVARNCTDALQRALRFCMRYLDAAAAETAEIIYKFNTVYDLANLPPDELVQVVAAWQNGALGWEEMRQRLKYSGLAYEDDDVVRAEAEERAKKQAELEANKAGETADRVEGAKAKHAPKPAAATKPGNRTGNRGRAAT